jgi:DNA (cytosine-5)-methyltransferase 1
MKSVVSLFSGAGGMDLGFIAAGYQVLYANDHNKHACESYKSNIGNHIVHDSIKNIDVADIPDSDVIIGGPPCQGFSVAGKMSADDERSQLVYDFAEIVVKKSPKAFVMENVDHLGKSPSFSKTKNSLLEIFKQAGYTVEVGILLASDFGVPQRRKRFFMIGVKSKSNDCSLIPTPTGEHAPTARDILQSFPPAGSKGNERTTNAKINFASNPVMRKSPYAGMMFNGLGRPIDLDRPVQTLAASFGGNKTPIIDINQLRDNEEPWIEKYHQWLSDGNEPNLGQAPSFLRRMTIDECIAFQDFPRDYELKGPVSSMFRQIGNAVPPGLAEAVASNLLVHI